MAELLDVDSSVHVRSRVIFNLTVKPIGGVYD